MALFSRVMGSIEESIRAANLRHQVTSQNIANLNVPGYRALEVSFEERLRVALRQEEGTGLKGSVAHLRHVPIGAEPTRPVVPVVQQSARGLMRPDGNNVDIESEMAKLAANQLWHQALARSLSDEFSRLRLVASDGRR